MADVEKYAKELQRLSEAAKDFKATIDAACGGSFKWGVEQVVSSYLSLFDRFCPFGVGDRVELTKNVPIEEGSGWYSCRHFLIRGARGTVRSRGYSGDKFVFDVEFDNETWIDKDGIEQPILKKHVFSFNESYLRSSN